jgi:PAS domain S-box-containing protein
MCNTTNSPLDTSKDLPGDQRQLIDAECISLVYNRSLTGMLGSIINAAAITLLLWHLVDTGVIISWLTAILIIGAVRCVLVRQFRKQVRTPDEIMVWGHWNTVAIGLTGALWAMTMVVLFPETSVPHQFCVVVIFCGLTAGAAGFYAFVQSTFCTFLAPIIIAFVIRFAMYPDMPHLLIASLAILFWVMMFLAAGSMRQTRRQLLMAKYNLMDRVSEGIQVVERTNTRLQAEIAERRDIEENLRQERDRLEVITRAIGAGLAVISKDYRIIWANRVFIEMFGEVEGLPCFSTQYQREDICDNCGAQMVFEFGNKSVTHEQKGMDAHGNTIWSQIITTPILDHKGQITAALELVLPITERKLAQEKQEQMAGQLEEARKAEAIATLASGIAHQFNNALAVIVGNTELLDQDLDNIFNSDIYIQPILKSARKMSRLTDQLLAYALGGKYRPRLADILEVAQTTLDLLKHTIPDTVEIHTRWGQPPKVKIDVTQMQMVLSAIVSNALEAVGRKGCIDIHCDLIIIDTAEVDRYGNITPGPCAEIIISDDGSGMDTGTLNRIFEPFFTTKFHGRGLGMAAVHGIVKNHGGHIGVASQPSKGTRVCIYLPGMLEKKAHQAISSSTEVNAGKTILLVEDDKEILALNQEQLERNGYKVILAANGQTAINIIGANHHAIDLVLLDLKLPDMDGRTILPVIHKNRPVTKVLVCSGYNMDDEEEELMNAGAHGFIHKPFTLNSLLKKIGQVLNTT